MPESEPVRVELVDELQRSKELTVTTGSGVATASSPMPAAASGNFLPTALEGLWRELQRSIRARIEPEQFATWFRRATLVQADDQVLRVGVQNDFARDWLERYYHETLSQAARETLGSPRRIEIAVVPEFSLPGPRRADPRDGGHAAPPARGPADGGQPARTSGGKARGGATQSGSARGREHGPHDDARSSATGGLRGEAQGLRADDEHAPRGRDEGDDTRRAPDSSRGHESLRGPGLGSELGLNPKYTFDNFVVGPCNRFAHAAAMGAAEQPGNAYNPFFLHGSVGLGKTHLLQSMCFAILARNPRTRILYLSCETFVNHFINALENGDIQKFRTKYRSVDVLVVDDIQVLANKERTQEEFFHTFNTLHQQGKQIVLSSDGPPKDIPTLQERLVSRFKWGLVTEMEPPCYETRMAILKRKSRERGRELPDEVASLLAERIESNIRELEGAVTRLLGFAQVSGAALSCDFARDVLRDLFTSRRPQPAMGDILALVTAHYDVKLSELQSKRRTAAIVLPRQIAMYIARRITRHSLEEIGGFFGGRDHSTVIYAIDKIQQLIASDVCTRDLVEDFLARLQVRSA